MVIAYLAKAMFGIDVLGAVSGNDPESSRNAKAGSSSVSKQLLAAARKYDDLRYIWGSGHPPDEPSSRRGMDCSGLINVAVMDVTGIKENHVAESFRRSKHWKKIKMKDAGPGDIMYRLISTHGGNTDHVVFVVENRGKDDLVTFEAYGSNNVPRKDQIGVKTHRDYSDFTGALRFVK